MQQKLRRLAGLTLSLAVLAVSGTALAQDQQTATTELDAPIETLASPELDAAIETLATPDSEPELLESTTNSCQMQCWSEYIACAKTGACHCEGDLDYCLAGCS